MISSSAITDFDRGQFLRKLISAFRAPNGLILSEWEKNFIGGFSRASRQSLWFTEPRRVSTDKMRMKYGGEPEIKMPFPPAESHPASVPEADADGCQFLTRADGLQTPCNLPAVWRRQNGFRYCQDHADAVLRDLKRRGQTMHLIHI